MAKDFRSKQIRTTKLIGSSSTAGSILSGKQYLEMLIASGSGTTNYDGGLSSDLNAQLSSLGDDTWLAIAGGPNYSATDSSGRGVGSTVTFLGDVVVSGTLYSERQVVEVDSTVPGDFYVKNNTLITGSFAASTVSVAGGPVSDLILADKSPTQTYRDDVGVSLVGPIVTFRKHDSPFPITITNGGDGNPTDGAQARSRMPQDVWFHVSGAIGGRHFAGDGSRGDKRYRGVALFDGDLHTSGNLSTDGVFSFAGFINNDLILINDSPSTANPESPSLFISSSAYTPVTASSNSGFMELATDQIGHTAFRAQSGTHWWVDLAHSGTNQSYGGIKFKVNDKGFAGSDDGATTADIGYSHRHEHRFTADGNFIMQSDLNNKTNSGTRALIFSGTDVYGRGNDARVEYDAKQSILTLKHATTGAFNFKNGVLSASNGVQFPEGDFVPTDDGGPGGAVANFGQQHGLMFQGSGAGRPEAGLYFNSATRTNPILGGDASTLLLKLASSQAADSIHIINQVGTGTDAVKIDSVAGGVDIDASGGVLSLDGASGINLGTASNVNVDINAAALDIDASAASAITNNTGGNDSFDLTIEVDGGGDSSLILQSDGTGSDAIQISTSAGGIDIDSSGAIEMNSTATVTIAGATGASLGDDTEALAYDGSGNVDFDAVVLDIDASGAVTIDSSGGSISIGGDDVNQNIMIGADGTRTIQIGAGDGTTTTTINSRGGTLTVDGTGQTIDVDSATLDIDTSGAVTIDAAVASSFTTTTGDLTLEATAGRVVLQGNSGADSVLIDSNARFNNDVRMMGNLVVEGDFTKHHTTNTSTQDPLILLNSGSSLSNTGAGIAIASGSNTTNYSLVMGRDNDNLDTFVFGKKDVSDGTATDLSDTDPLLVRASGYDVGTRYSSTPFITSSNPTRVPGTDGTLLTQAQRQDRMHVSMSNRSTDGDILMRMNGNLIVSSSNTVLRNASKLWFNPTTSDGGPYWIGSNSSDNKLDLHVGAWTGGLMLRSDSGVTSKIYFDDTGKYIGESNTSALLLVSDEAIDIDADGGVLSLDGSGGINIGTESDVAIDMDASTLDIDAAAGFTITGGAASTLSTTVGEVTVRGGSGATIYGGGGSTSPAKISGSQISFQGPVYFSEDPAIGGPFYVSTGSASYKKLTIHAGTAGSVRLEGQTDRAQLEFDNTAVIRNVSSSYFAVESRSGLRLDSNKNNYGGETFGVQLSGSAFSFQHTKRIYFSEHPGTLSYIQHDGVQLKISAKEPLRLQDANRIEFGNPDSRVGIDAENRRFGIHHAGNGSDIFLSSSTDYGKITLQVSSSGAALQIVGDNGVAGQSFISMGYVSGTLEEKTTANLDAGLIVSGAVDGIHNSRVQYGAQSAQRGVALFMGDLLTSGAVHVEKNMIASGTIATKGNLLEFTDGTTRIEKDGLNNLKFTDANAGGVTLTDLNSKVLGADEVFLVAPGGPGNDYYTTVRTTGSFSFDYDPTDAAYSPRATSDIGTDVYFFVSGTVGGKTNHRNTRTVAVFGGDVHISGSVTSTAGAIGGGSLDTSYDTADAGSNFSGAGAIIDVDSRPVQLKRGDLAYASETLLAVSGSSTLYNLKVGEGTTSPDTRLTLTGSSGALEFFSNPSGLGEREIFKITGGSGNIQIAAHATDGKLAFAQESATYIRLDNSSTPKDLQIYNTTSNGKITLKTGASAGSPGTVEVQGNILPTGDNLYDLGSTTQRFANLYTGDLHLRNERGDWTIYEEPDMLVVVNNLTGKKYKMNLTPLEDKE